MTMLGEAILPLASPTPQESQALENQLPTIDGQREKINALDEFILTALIERGHEVMILSDLKDSDGTPVRNRSVEDAKVKALQKSAVEQDGDPSIVEPVWDVMFRLSRAAQEQKRNIGHSAISKASEIQ